MIDLNRLMIQGEEFVWRPCGVSRGFCAAAAAAAHVDEGEMISAINTTTVLGTFKAGISCMVGEVEYKV